MYQVSINVNCKFMPEYCDGSTKLYILAFWHFGIDSELLYNHFSTANRDSESPRCGGATSESTTTSSTTTVMSPIHLCYTQVNHCCRADGQRLFYTWDLDSTMALLVLHLLTPSRNGPGGISIPTSLKVSAQHWACISSRP
jgi:hypothetical protein